MVFLEKAIARISPGWALKREVSRQKLEILNAGYDEGGASLVKRSLKGWSATSAGPREDIDLNLDILRKRSRQLFMNSPIGSSAINTNRTNVIGPGLRLKSHIDSDFLKMSPEQASEWQRKTEREFNIWAKSKHCDALGVNDFADMQAIAFTGQLINGDAWCLFKSSPAKTWMPYSTRLLLIEADRISTPWHNSNLGLVDGINPETKNRIISGIEIDANGKAVAAWICNTYPNSYTGYVLTFERKWERVELFGEKTGRPNILQLMKPERAGQYRGVPYLAPVIETVKQLARYTEAEIAAAVVSAFFTVFVKTSDPTNEKPFGSMTPDASPMTQHEDKSDLELGPGAINVLGEGEDITLANPARPNQHFDGFVLAMSRQIGAALEIPSDVLLKQFSASYSASRGALLEAWKSFKVSRQWVAKEFCQPVYEEWLAEAVAIGRVKAQGFFLDPLIRAAWCRAEWHGPAPGQIDPLKEVIAAQKRIELCLSTRQRESIEINGSDFDNNVRELGREISLIQQFGASDIEPGAPANKSQKKRKTKEVTNSEKVLDF